MPATLSGSLTLTAKGTAIITGSATLRGALSLSASWATKGKAELVGDSFVRARAIVLAPAAPRVTYSPGHVRIASA